MGSYDLKITSVDFKRESMLLHGSPGQSTSTYPCSVSGVTDYFAETEAEGFDILRDTVATLNVAGGVVSPAAEEPAMDAEDLNGEDGWVNWVLHVIARVTSAVCVL